VLQKFVGEIYSEKNIVQNEASRLYGGYYP
jgi:hypothetical protein